MSSACNTRGPCSAQGVCDYIWGAWSKYEVCVAWSKYDDYAAVVLAHVKRKRVRYLWCVCFGVLRSNACELLTHSTHDTLFPRHTHKHSFLADNHFLILPIQSAPRKHTIQIKTHPTHARKSVSFLRDRSV